METRNSIATEFRAETREQDSSPIIEAYFAVFGDVYDMGCGITESIDPHAFDDAINDDVRCLVDHDTAKVLGRTKAGTLKLVVDNYGLKGIDTINLADTEATNCYARVDRGDVSQCSFGFDILEEECEVRPDGTCHYTIKRVKLYEVSICTFPAYEKTEATARSARRAQAFDLWQNRLKERINKWH